MPKRTYRRKLIEFAPPLDEISRHAVRDKYLRSGHPSTLHRWWARRPLAACRAVLFASLVDDPIDCPDEFPTEEKQRVERQRLHAILKDVLVWEKTDQSKAKGRQTINAARFEIARSLARARGEDAPADTDEVLRYLTSEESGLVVYDPFCGGGSVPLEAQRLGLRSAGSDLNPVAVLLTKSMIELPAQFYGAEPVSGHHDTVSRRPRTNSLAKKKWHGYEGLANDVRFYGRKVREEVFKRIGHLYPEVKLESGEFATVVAWLWANTIPCSNPACGIDMPLIRNFQLSKKQGNAKWVKPNFDSPDTRVSFSIADKASPGASPTVSRDGATCLACATPSTLEYVREQSSAGHLRQQLIAIAVESRNGRVYVNPTSAHEEIALQAIPARRPPASLPCKARSISLRAYGLTEWHQLFTERQLMSLCLFSDLTAQITDELIRDGIDSDYATAIRTYLALAVGRLAHVGSRLSMWENGGDRVAGVFGRQSIGMVWDFAESNPFSLKAQNWLAQVEWVAKVVERLPSDTIPGKAFQADAANTQYEANGPVIVTDPPYYDNIGYADISDFFYVWHRDMLHDVYPELFIGVQTPKINEIVAGPMFENPREHFETSLSKALQQIRSSCSNEYPSSIFYAYKQKERTKEGVSSTGWETFLTAVTQAGFQIVGTWPVRTEGTGRLNKLQGNMLASSVVLVLRPRPEDARVASRREFINELHSTLPGEIDKLTREGNIAPIDLAQAAIGPGMKVYTSYSAVETITGELVSVKTALQEINRVIADYFLHEQGDLDAETRFCCDWLAEYEFELGPNGDAETLARAKNLEVDGLSKKSIITGPIGKVKLIHYGDFDADERTEGVNHSTTAWEGCMVIAKHLDGGEEGRGIEGAADIVRQLGPEKAAQVERLARILFNHYDLKFQPAKARVFNEIANSWREIQAIASMPQQGDQAELGRAA